MGRYTLLIVLAAAVGGSYLTLNVLRSQSDTLLRRSDAQSALLARQLAEGGEAIALSSVTQLDGFRDSGGLFVTERDHEGGTMAFEQFNVASFPGGRQRASVGVAGIFDAATHRLQSVYEFQPMEFPGPLWLDVPYASAVLSPASDISGGGTFNYEPQIDPSKFDDLHMHEFGLSFGGIRSALAGIGAPVGNWNTTGKPRTDGLGDGISTGDDLYYAVCNAFDAGAGDTAFSGDLTISGADTFGSPAGITHVQGALTVPAGASLTGEGALVVEGDFVVEGSLDWTGLIIVRTEEDFVRVELNGNADVTGAVVVSQEAFPPGGHIDLTIFRQPNGTWTTSFGERNAGPGSLRASPWTENWVPFWNHVHRFDLPEPGDADAGARANSVIRLVDAASGDPQETAYMGLRELLDHLGSTPVQVELTNVKRGHGHAMLEMEVDGMPAVSRSLMMGFNDTALAGGQKFRSATFPARDLERLVVTPQSLRSLTRLWDTDPVCPGAVAPTWPLCVGMDRNGREEALTIRVRQASNGRSLYEASVYWHMQDGAESAEYLTSLASWQAGVTSGSTPFGTAFEMGPQASIAYELAPVAALAEKVGFAGNQVVRVSTTSDSPIARMASPGGSG
ncbi:MAG: hypothetical protein AAGK21_05845, partial [Bacteroidota bacterium]